RFGDTSCGSSETVSPGQKTLPAKARRTVSGDSDACANREPVTCTCLAGRTGTGATLTCAPSVNPRFINVSSSSRTIPVGEVRGAGAARAAVTRAPVNCTASHERRSRAFRTSGCSRTIPRRLSVAEDDSLAVSVMDGTGPSLLAADRRGGQEAPIPGGSARLLAVVPVAAQLQPAPTAPRPARAVVPQGQPDPSSGARDPAAQRSPQPELPLGAADRPALPRRHRPGLGVPGQPAVPVHRE